MEILSYMTLATFAFAFVSALTNTSYTSTLLIMFCIFASATVISSYLRDIVSTIKEK